MLRFNLAFFRAFANELGSPSLLNDLPSPGGGGGGGGGPFPPSGEDAPTETCANCVPHMTDDVSGAWGGAGGGIGADEDTGAGGGGGGGAGGPVGNGGAKGAELFLW